VNCEVFFDTPPGKKKAHVGMGIQGGGPRWSTDQTSEEKRARVGTTQTGGGVLWGQGQTRKGERGGEPGNGKNGSGTRSD